MQFVCRTLQKQRPGISQVAAGKYNQADFEKTGRKTDSPYNLFYRLLRYVSENDPQLLCCFLHIPPDESQIDNFPAGTPFMPVSEVVRTLKITMDFLSAQ